MPSAQSRYARSAEFLNTPTVQMLRWMRVPGDSLFAVGAIALVLFVFGLGTGHSVKKQIPKPKESRKVA